jgi:hypothetical protein
MKACIFPSLKRRGGCGIEKKSRSHRSAADGVVSSAKSLGLNDFAELTTPSAPIRNGSILLMARPPLLFKEGNMPNSRFCQFIHTLYDHRACATPTALTVTSRLQGPVLLIPLCFPLQTAPFLQAVCQHRLPLPELRGQAPPGQKSNHHP